MGGASSWPNVNADSRFPCKGRTAIFGRRPIWIKGPHGAGNAPLVALVDHLHDVYAILSHCLRSLSQSVASTNGKLPCALNRPSPTANHSGSEIAFHVPSIRARYTTFDRIPVAFAIAKIAKLFESLESTVISIDPEQ